jgi:hypothetical protein
MRSVSARDPKDRWKQDSGEPEKHGWEIFRSPIEDGQPIDPQMLQRSDTFHTTDMEIAKDRATDAVQGAIKLNQAYSPARKATAGRGSGSGTPES